MPMTLSPNLLNLALWTGGILLSLAGIAWILRCLFADRARGRRRCPSCWYDFAGLAANSRCPECGCEGLTERHLSRTRRRWPLACLAFIPLIAGYITWTTPRVFEENSATGFFPTTFLVLAAPTLDAKAIADGSNLRGLTFARLNRGEIKRPWRWLWRQRIKLAHTLTGTPYIEVAWDDVKLIYPPPEPVQPVEPQESPFIHIAEMRDDPTLEYFGAGLEALAKFDWILAPDDPGDFSCVIAEYWLATGSAAKIQRARDVRSILQRARADVLRGELPPHRRFDLTDVDASNAVLERLESTFVPAWEGTTTLPQLAEKLSLAAGCPVDLDLEPAALTEYESTLKPAASPAASVRVTLDTLCTDADTPITWTVRDGRIILQRRPAREPRSIWIQPDYVDPSLVIFDVSDLLADESEILGKYVLVSEKQARLTNLITWNIDPDSWITNAGYHTLGVVGNFLAVEADLPTIHLIGLLIDFMRQLESNLGRDRRCVLTWGEMPRDRDSLCGSRATLSGTRSNSQIVAYSLDLILAEAISEADESESPEFA